MPLPLLFIGIAAATSLTGIGSAAKAFDDKQTANKISTIANEHIEDAKNNLELQRTLVSESLSNLGLEKVTVLDQNVMRFLRTFEKLKNVDFRDSLGLDEIKNLHIDSKEFEELKSMGNLAVDMTKGLVGGTAAGALTAFGAYSAAGSLAAASTGTAISSLSGIAASNATLAYFGGGSLASGGLGMAGGQMVLGGFVAGPALMIMGIYSGVKAQEQLDSALANKAESEAIVEELRTLAFQCSAVRRRVTMFYCLLAKLDVQFYELINKMESIVETEGYDYSLFKGDSKKVIAMCASNAATIKAILDTPILNGDGNLTEESQQLIASINQKLQLN